MKKTANLTLAILGTTILGSCTQKGDVDTAAYRDTHECINAGTFSADICLRDYAQAVMEQRKNAPSFRQKEDCEEEFGSDKCEPATASHYSGGGGYVPYLRGYLIGRNASTSNGVYYPAVPTQALYESRKVQGFVNADGSFVTNKMGGFKMSANADALSKPAIRTTTIARSGFGARSVVVS